MISDTIHTYIKKHLGFFKGRHTTLLFGGIAIVFLSIGLIIGNGEESKPEHTVDTYEPVSYSTPPCIYMGNFEDNTTLSDALNPVGVPLGEIYEIQNSLAGVFSFRRLRPKDRFSLCYSADGDTMRFELQRYNNLVSYEVVRTPDTIYAIKDSLPLEYNLLAAYGTVHKTLWASMRSAGMPPKLIMNFTDILAYDFDFVTDTRNGQKFWVLYEVYTFEGKPAKMGKILFGQYEELSGTKHAACYFETPDGKDGYYNLDGKSVKRSLLKTPLVYSRISSHFTYSRFHPILKKFRPHLGVDFAAPTGTPVVASGSGRVTFCGWKGGYGNFIQISHPQGIVTMYGHLNRFSKGIKKGVSVREGQVIAYVGSTGLSTGPHLDYRVKVNGKFVNPLRYAFPTGPPVPAKYLAQFKQIASEIEDVTLTLARPIQTVAENTQLQERKEPIDEG